MRAWILTVVCCATSLLAFSAEPPHDVRKMQQEMAAGVESALRWFARHQAKDGGWQAVDVAPASRADRVLTSLVLTTFRSAGHSEQRGAHAEIVKRGSQWLLSQAGADGRFGDGIDQAICTRALVDMPKGPNVEALAQRAVDHCVRLQRHDSGWGAAPGAEVDVASTAWFVVTLKAAEKAGYKVDAKTYQGVTLLLDKLIDEKGRYRPRESANAVSPDATAAAMVCRFTLGAVSGDRTVDGGVAYLLESIPSLVPAGKDPDPATWYLGSIAAYHASGELWKAWCAAAAKDVSPKQRKGGPMDGSPQDKDGSWSATGSVATWGGMEASTALMTLGKIAWFASGR